jgi:hypothetical protein
MATGFGESGNVVSCPDKRDLDISIIKKIPLNTESRNLECRAEFFNPFNAPSFTSPALDVGTVAPNPLAGLASLQPSPTLGTITSTTVAPRRMQFALKFYF